MAYFSQFQREQSEAAVFKVRLCDLATPAREREKAFRVPRHLHLRHKDDESEHQHHASHVYSSGFIQREASEETTDTASPNCNLCRTSTRRQLQENTGKKVKFM